MRLGHFFLMINEYNRKKEQEFRLQAELVRIQTTKIVNVHIMEEDQMRPEQLWPMPWDPESDNEKRLKQLSPKEFREAYNKFIHRK